ncbi:MAG: D-alanyl-D-alanine carboxypeptidase family protein [Alphaproteobacteria bacterium]
MRLIALVVCFVALAPVAPARAQTDFETLAEAAILIDYPSRQILYAKNADEPRPPASMSKLMTAFMVFERLEEGQWSLDDRLLVSEKAWRMGGSKMFVEVGERVRVEDLLRGIIVQSGNDACIVVAEAMAGTEEAFAEQMNERGRELGLDHSVFENSSGWPDPGHVMSVRDLAHLAAEIIDRFPKFYHLYSEKSFTYADITQDSRNPLLQGRVDGVDGLKTGHTTTAGYGLVASAERDGRRLILVVTGLDTPGERRREAERLLEHGYRAFQSYELFAGGETIEEAPVWFGDRARVPLVADEAVEVTLSVAARDELEVDLAYEAPVKAPIAAGTPVGELRISAPEVEDRTVPVVVGADVGRASVFGRMWTALRHLVGMDT